MPAVTCLNEARPGINNAAHYRLMTAKTLRIDKQFDIWYRPPHKAEALVIIKVMN